jgi:outer membrane murein-binding lipoprotein Lpp
MKTKSFVTLLVVAVILGSAIGGALAGGVAIGKSQGKSEARQTLLSQIGQYSSTTGQGNATTGQGNFQLPGNYTGTLPTSRATVGTVEKVEGSLITLKTSTDTVLVNTGNSTSIQKMAEGSLADISPGENITVSGNKNADGSIEARSITITSGFTLPSFGGGGQSQ